MIEKLVERLKTAQEYYDRGAVNLPNYQSPVEDLFLIHKELLAVVQTSSLVIKGSPDWRQLAGKLDALEARAKELGL